MQKYIHLVQIMETEKVAANQLRTQLEDQETEIERLKAEVCTSVSLSVYTHEQTQMHHRAKTLHKDAPMHLQEFRVRMRHESNRSVLSL